MKKTFRNILSTMIEYLPVVVGAGLIALLLGLGIVRGQTTATGAATAPSWSAMAIGATLVVIGAIAIAAPLIASLAYQRRATARQEGSRHTGTFEQERAVAQGEPAAEDEDER